MDFDLTAKFLLGAFSALGTMALVFFNLSQTRKIKAELLEKFEDAVSRANKHSVTELFRLIHGLRMNYADIIELVKHDNCSKIIFSLKKTPGLVSYRGGKFRYSKIASNRIFRFVDKFFMRLSIFTFSAFTLFSFGVLIFGKGTTAVVGFVFLILSSMMLAFQLRQRNYDQMVSDLVEPEHNNLIQQTENVSAD
ncbi:hypothetical protein [Rheinheimera sp.]|uniref:hypothetical protein n=1 Tax=Rheinheimera sp. TaxID=1869214 RepID=UPI002733419E|nr:hypothetical protein [Rheinheimera sp.]MDP2713390.1 hypothetical protein [Rheinheimera sp.]